jgi:hypothetical protein
MGIGMQDVEYLSARGCLDDPGTRVLDIGSQCVLSATKEAILSFVAKHGAKIDRQALDKEAERVAYFSTPRPGERTSYLSELLAVTPIAYRSYDVCMALETTIFDLNRDTVPPADQKQFDVVLNCGTTEHVVNQLNCFRVMHDATKVGGWMLHQLPASGYAGHGYFCYHELFFRDVAEANAYEIEDLWFSVSGQRIEGPNHAPGRDVNINVLMRKTKDAPFSLWLELATAHSTLSGNVSNYADDVPEQKLELNQPSYVADYRYVSWKLLAHEVVRRARRRAGMLFGI